MRVCGANRRWNVASRTVHHGGQGNPSGDSGRWNRVMEAGKEQDTLVRQQDWLGWSRGYRQRSRRRKVQKRETEYGRECEAREDCTWISQPVGASEWDAEKKTCMIITVSWREEIT